MKKFLAAGLVCVAGPAMAASVWNAPADVAAISAIVQQSKVQLDGASVARTYAPDAVVLNYKAGEIYQGRTAIQAAAAAAPLKSVKSNIREQSILTNGSFACAMLTVDYQFIAQDGKPGTLSLRQMDALKKNGERWEVVQEHLSVPMDPKTGLAVTGDLQVRGPMVWPADLSAGQRVPVAQAENEIKKWADDSFRAMPLNALMPFYGPGPNDMMSYAPTEPGNIRGKVELEAYLAPSLANTMALDIDVHLIKVDTDGELGAQIDQQYITSHFKGGASDITYWRQSDCLRRVDGKWYGAMAMATFPVDWKTGKSIVLVNEIPAK